MCFFLTHEISCDRLLVSSVSGPKRPHDRVYVRLHAVSHKQGEFKQSNVVFEPT